MRSLVLPASLLAQVAGVALAAAQTVAPPMDSLARGRHYTQWFFSGQADSLWAHLSPAAQEALGSVAAIRTESAGMQQWGVQGALLSEQIIPRGTGWEYRRTMRMTHEHAPMMATLIFNANGEIVGWRHGKASEVDRNSQP